MVKPAALRKTKNMLSKRECDCKDDVEEKTIVCNGSDKYQKLKDDRCRKSSCEQTWSVH